MRGSNSTSQAASPRPEARRENTVERPVIGLTTYLEKIQQGDWNVRAAFLHEQYVRAVESAGGTVVLLPPLPSGGAASILDRVDGLVLTGGYDVDPSLYGQQRHAQSDPADPARDSWEMSLIAEAERRRLPLLAICRGFQLLNVFRGGTLVQHLPDALGSDRYRAGGGTYARNTVQIVERTRLARALSSGRHDVQSYHHQGVDRLGDGLVISARSDDDLVQALEDVSEDWYTIAVQWHPEQGPTDRALFADFVDQARARAPEERS